MQTSDSIIHSDQQWADQQRADQQLADQQRVQAHLDVIQHLALLLLRGETGYLSAPQRRCIESIAFHTRQLLATRSSPNHEATLQPHQAQQSELEFLPLDATHVPLQHFVQEADENGANSSSLPEFSSRPDIATIVDLPLALPALHQHSLLHHTLLDPSMLTEVPTADGEHSIVSIGNYPDNFPDRELEIRIPPHQIEFTQITVITTAIADAGELRKLFSPTRRSERASPFPSLSNSAEQHSLITTE